MEKGQPLRIVKTLLSAQEMEGQPGQVLSFIKNQGIAVKTADGVLLVQELQRQGKKSLNYKDFMNGARDFVGTVLE